MTRGWLPETVGAGSLGLNGGGDAAAVPPFLCGGLAGIDLMAHVSDGFARPPLVISSCPTAVPPPTKLEVDWAFPQL